MSMNNSIVSSAKKNRSSNSFYNNLVGNTDEEPCKPMFSMPTVSSDLKKEIEMQYQRIEEMHINGEFKRTNTTTEDNKNLERKTMTSFNP